MYSDLGSGVTTANISQKMQESVKDKNKIIMSYNSFVYGLAEDLKPENGIKAK